MYADMVKMLCTAVYIYIIQQKTVTNLEYLVSKQLIYSTA